MKLQSAAYGASLANAAMRFILAGAFLLKMLRRGR